ncbi:MAG: M48 family peptidase [Candidatus Omnitrophota bacterium]|nr:MAG: M48 family peptidase [Candidatus Omnitrophota bacterium]
MPEARKYSNIKYALAIIDTFYALGLIFIFLYSGLSKESVLFLSSKIGQAFILPVYILAIYSGYFLFTFPLNFYGSFVVEHKFSLSTQSFFSWISDQIKSGLLMYVLSLGLFFLMYIILEKSQDLWWLWVSLIWLFFSVILARLMPVVVIPMFFKYRELADQGLKSRIMDLAVKMNIRLLDVFEIDFSRKTLKANAAFVGMGKTKRVILADTLKDKYTHQEIEVILAHEFAHYRSRHLLKLIILNSIVTLLTFYFIYLSSSQVLLFFGIDSLSRIYSLPVIIGYFIILGLVLQPISNAISRKFEREADKIAIDITGLKKPFISMMDKLAKQNLADVKPSFLIKMIFFDHPPVSERIEMAERYQQKGTGNE